ncbi:3-hydroxyisobutyryl-CoA hydrolase [Pterulicium gracile]|uniref:3-hydroxyisobutyryl-CoA hydrolase n=1 Tax=Pterulicium gracile TaxID=1884261 RepID=A0A5C3R2X7_9AGAR|nr:3-hydroxyisobutyryl-CoA hydrolase [Pterula gracilis]
MSSPAVRRSRLVAGHMMSTRPNKTSEDLVLFESKSAVRVYSLNRPAKHNALNAEMLDLLRNKIMEWNKSDLCGTIVGRGVGKSFCAGGDVLTVVENAKASSRQRNHQAIQFFKDEFDLDYLLASMNKPYVVVMHGNTMGGGVGLSLPAQFRIATETTVYAMPETKIGYYPDVGASYYLSRLDGELGTFIGLTGDSIRGRSVFEAGIATHYIPEARLPALLERLSTLENPTLEVVNNAIEELSLEYQADETTPTLASEVRIAIDSVFRHNTVEEIFADLETNTSHASPVVQEWAKKTLAALNERSPTSLTVSLEAIRRGKNLKLEEALNMELQLSFLFCRNRSPDFTTGVQAVLGKDRKKGRPAWKPSTIAEVDREKVIADFFHVEKNFPTVKVPMEDISSTPRNPMRYALPTEEEIRAVVAGSATSGGSTSVTLPELVARFQERTNGKYGVKEKVEEVVARQCQVVDNNDGNFVWLKWRPKKLDEVSA